MCYFAVWGGALRVGSTFIAVPEGSRTEPKRPPPAPADWQLDLSAPTFSFPTCGDSSYYHLFEGGLGEAVRIGRWVNESWFLPQSPHFVWPSDHSWCVATGRTEDSTLIGGSRDLVNELCGSKDIEVLQIAPDAPYEDQVNL